MTAPWFKRFEKNVAMLLRRAKSDLPDVQLGELLIE
jgi:hypothetical protein